MSFRRSDWARLAAPAVLALLAACGREAPPAMPTYTTAPIGEAAPVYRFAILPLHNPHKSHAVFDPLVRYLQARIPEARFEFEASRDFAAFERKLERREVAFALPNPYETLLAIKQGYRVFAKMAPDDDFRGVFVVRRDSDIRQTADLRGKVVAYPAPTALAAALQAQHYLRVNGLDVDREVENRYVGSQDSSILAVYYRQADAGVTWPPTWRVFQRGHPREAGELRLAWRTDVLPNLPFVARDDVPAPLLEKVRDVLLGMDREPEGRAILATMEFSAVVAADDAVYEPVRRFVREFSALVRPIDTYETDR